MSLVRNVTFIKTLDIMSLNFLEITRSMLKNL